MLGVIHVPTGFDAETPIGGLRPLLRHALSLQAAGAREVRLVGPGADAPLDPDPRLRVPVARAGAVGGETIVVLPADVTFHRLVPTRLARMAPGDGDAFAVGGPDATGYVAGAARGAALVEALSSGHIPDAESRPLEAGEFVLPARSPRERRRSLSHHLASLKKATAGVLDRYLMRPISLQLTRVLCRTPVTPNHVSLLCLFLGLTGAALVAWGDDAQAALGAWLFIVLRIIDCVDGELARLRYQGTRFGEWLDTVGDGVGIASLLAASTYRLALTDAHPAWTGAGVLAVLGYMTMQSIQYRTLVAVGGHGGTQTIAWSHRKAPRTLFERFAANVDVLFREDIVTVFFSVMILAGTIGPMLLVTALGTVGASLYFVVELRRRAG